MSRSKKKFPVWYKMLVAIIPGIALVVVSIGIAVGIQVSPFALGVLTILVGKVIGHVMIAN